MVPAAIEFECLSAATMVLDLANGLDDDKSLLTGLFALELAQHGGLRAAQQRSAFYVGLLRHLGCTAFASVESTLAADDIALRRRLIHSDSSNPGAVVSAVAGANRSLAGAAQGLSRLLTSTRRLRREWTNEACGAARVLSAQLGFTPEVVRALDEAFERWDGAGGPRGLKGEAISELGRVTMAAHVAVVFLLSGGPTLSREMLALRSGNLLDPRWAKVAANVVQSFEATARSPERLAGVEKAVLDEPLPATLTTIAATFGDVADLQSPFTRGHSRKVAEVCERSAATLGLSAAEQSQLVLAAHFHDIGQIALPTGLWLSPRWSDADRRRGASHSYFTERVLTAMPSLGPMAAIASAHHERLDGAGGHRGLSGASLPRAARVLAAADFVCELKEVRPHRPAHDGHAVRSLTGEAVRSGHLDADCAEAALQAIGERAAPGRSAALQLTEREIDVLRLIARGQTNKQVARALRISDRTVQHHSIHIYEKLGVNSRAAATLLAVKAGLV